MEVWQAAVLGLVEGLTEYLPVSSTGHLLLAQRAMGIEQSAASNAFAICIQAGAILAVFALYRARLAGVLAGIRGRDEAGRRLFVNLVVAFVPAGAIGLLLGKPIERALFGLWPVVFAWMVGGLFLLWLARRKLPANGFALESMATSAAAIIGLCQCVALCPGISRSLATIAGALLCGASLAAAIEFSFLLGLLTLSGATVYKAVQHGSALLEGNGVLTLCVGLAVAFVSAWVSVRWMVRSLNARTLAGFGWYRMGLASIVATLLLIGALEAN